MKARTLKLLFPVIAITVQNNVAWLILSPYLQHLQFPVATIGSLIALSPVFSLASRLPSGVFYKQERARVLITIGMVTTGLCNFLYSAASNSLIFALVHGVNGFAYGAVTTLYMAFYVDSLPVGENRSHAMGYYVGSLAVGYSTGNFLSGYLADLFGYSVTFYIAALLSLVSIPFIWFLGGAGTRETVQESGTSSIKPRFGDFLAAVLDPKMAVVVVVALFLNFLNQVGGVFFPLYGLSVGLTLTQVGVIRALYSLCNAVTRPLSGLVVNRFGHRRLSYGGFAIQSVLMAMVPFFTSFAPLVTLFLTAGFMRAVAIVGNAVGLVQDVDESKIPRGVASGIYNAAGDLGNISGPIAGGLIASIAGVAGLFVGAPLGATVFFLAIISMLQRRG
jgi:predicted MFS family arabinose efflux permease